MSGYASYEDALDSKYGEPFPVPVVTATAETLKGYGRIVTDFENEKVEITPWPVKGRGPSPILPWIFNTLYVSGLNVVGTSTSSPGHYFRQNEHTDT